MTHEELVRNLVKDGNDIANEMTAETAHLLHMAVGISGESGELLDAIKKHVIYNKALDVDNVREELGDLYFYMQGIINSMPFSKDDVLNHNIEKLTKRYGDKYSDKSAQERADKIDGQ